MLKDKVWETRKARINAETRLNRYGFLSETLLPWYSVHLIIANIFPFKYSLQVNVILSLMLIVFSLILSSQKFRVKARDMRSHYIQLEKIYQQLNTCTEEESHDIYDRYLEVLNQVDNHASIDFLKVIPKLSDSNQ